MSAMIPEAFRDLLADDCRAFAVLGTIMPDGAPQVTPVWFDSEGDLLRINTARGRVKERNLTARPQAALAILDPQNPYRYMQVRGRVVEVTERNAREHIDRLAHKYTGAERFENLRPGDVRVIFKIRPESVSTTG